MFRFSRYSVILVVLLVLAGCSGFPGSGPDASNVRVTPADVPTDDRTAVPRGQIAPGVTSTGVYNASALTHAHAQTLGNTSFTIRVNLTYHYTNGTQAGQTIGKLRVESGPPVLIQAHYRFAVQQSDIRRSNRSPAIAGDRWYGPDSRYGRTIYANNTTSYRAIPERMHRDSSYDLTYFRTINRTLSDVDTQVTQLTRNGSTYYRIEGPMKREYLSASSSNKQNSSQNNSQWLLIDSRGVIHEYHYTVTSLGPNETTMHRHYDVSFQRIGNTTVKQPAWVEKARNRTEPTNRTTARS
jgi:hypothetical protein